MTRLLEILARWRTWIVNGILAMLFALPAILNSPEILAVIPPDYQRWFLVAAFLVNIWMRPRPAVLSTDPEADMRRDQIGKGR